MDPETGQWEDWAQYKISAKRVQFGSSKRTARPISRRSNRSSSAPSWTGNLEDVTTVDPRPVIGEDYVLAAQANPPSTRRIMFTYAARNAILPNIAGFALAIGYVIAGAIVMEIVFSYPGVGFQLYNAVTSDDVPVDSGVFLAISVGVLLMVPALRRGVHDRRSADAHQGGVLMAVAVAQPPVVAQDLQPRRGHFLRNMPLKAKVGGVILLLFVVLGIFGPLFAPFPPTARNAINPNSHGIPLAPTLTHLFGTDTFGRDIFSEWLVSLRATVELGVLTATIASVLTVSVGVTAGFLGGVADEGLSLLTNIFLVLPQLPLLIIVLVFLPGSSVVVVALVLALLGWSWGARVIRAETLERCAAATLSERRARTASGAGRLVVFEVLPNQVSLIAANFVGTFLYAILTSVALAFIGVTRTPPGRSARCSTGQRARTPSSLASGGCTCQRGCPWRFWERASYC